MTRSHKMTERLQQSIYSPGLKTVYSYYIIVSESYSGCSGGVPVSRRTQSRQNFTSYNHLAQRIGKIPLVHGQQLRMGMDDGIGYAELPATRSLEVSPRL